MNSKTTLFVSHGGGPLPLLGDEGHREMVETLQKIRTMLTTPQAIIMISAHWEEQQVTVTSGSTPSLIYDYYGFPPEAYRVNYPAPGSPELASIIADHLSSLEIPVDQNSSRGFDHGMFVPLSILFPEADIPVVQLSLIQSLDPRQHIEIGKALASLSYEDLLIVGSGYTFHNMRAFFESHSGNQKENEFDIWLEKTLTDSSITEHERERRLIDWATAPLARYSHPREEHLLPLHLCYGVEHRPASASFHATILNRDAGFFLWNGEQ